MLLQGVKWNKRHHRGDSTYNLGAKVLGQVLKNGKGRGKIWQAYVRDEEVWGKYSVIASVGSIEKAKEVVEKHCKEKNTVANEQEIG